MDNLPPCQLRIIPTDKPGVRSFIVRVAESAIRPENLPSVDVTYALWNLPVKVRGLETWGEYVYKKDVDAPEGYVGFLFVKPDGTADAATGLTAEQETPYETWHSTEEMTWPAVLRELPTFTADPRYMVSSPYGDVDGNYEGRVVVPRIYVDDQYFVDAQRIATVFKHEKFQSASPWPKSAITHRTMQATSLRLELPGLGVWQLPECLHPEINTSELVPDIKYRLIRQISGATQVSTAPAPMLPQQIFPATNFRDWTSHVVSDVVTPTEAGVFTRHKITALRPMQPRRAMNG